MGSKSPSAAKLNARCFLHVENKPGQSYGRYFQAGRAEMLPAHWALAGREKGRRRRRREQMSPSPRKPEQWKPQAALAAALPPAEAEGGGTVIVAQERCSAGAVAGAASRCPAAAILLVSAGRIKQWEHPLPCQG